MITYDIAGRGDASGVTTYNVLFNSEVIDTGATATASPFASTTSDVFTVSDGTYTLQFLNTITPGVDAAFLLDNVHIVAVPEPGALSLLAVCGVPLLRRRAQRG